MRSIPAKSLFCLPSCDGIGKSRNVARFGTYSASYLSHAITQWQCLCDVIQNMNQLLGNICKVDYLSTCEISKILGICRKYM